MSRATASALVLVAALVGSNAFWLYLTVDGAITHTHAVDQCRLERHALEQTLALLPVAASATHSRDQIIGAARVSDATAPFEKDGFLWVGQIGLRFDANGRLSGVRTAWQ